MSDVVGARPPPGADYQSQDEPCRQRGYRNGEVRRRELKEAFPKKHLKSNPRNRG